MAEQPQPVGLPGILPTGSARIITGLPPTEAPASRHEANLAHVCRRAANRPTAICVSWQPSKLVTA